MKSVVICGSNKFATDARAFAAKLRKMGAHVLEPHFYSASGGDFAKATPFDRKFIALGLTHDHFYKIRKADVVFIYNKNGYAGPSTTMEIGYAVALNKPIYALSEKDEELCRSALMSGITKTPAELVKKLR